MKKDQLEALIIDNEFGELPEEVSSLLGAYLATQKDARMEAEKIRNSLDLTRQAVVDSPKIFRASSLSETDFLGRIAMLLTFLKSRNSAFALLIILSAMAGFVLKGSIQPESAVSSRVVVESSNLDKKPESKKPLWASYRIDDGGNPVLLLASSLSPSKR